METCEFFVPERMKSEWKQALPALFNPFASELP
jgi:hypothetical protein